MSQAPHPINVGDHVISWDDDQPVQYGGQDPDRPARTTLTFAVGGTGLPIRRCEAERAAPADVPIPAQDARVSVVKASKADTPPGVSGSWRLTLPDVEHPSWHRIKRDAIATGLRRLAILDWHTGAVQTGPVVLPHTGMTVPHARFAMRKLRSMPTSDGEAYTAELLLDGTPVGAVENTGTGGATTWYPLNREVLDRSAMEAFVAQCRDENGEAMAEEFVLAELFEEARTARDIARYVKANRTPVRTLAAITSDGTEAVATFPDAYYGVPSEWADKPDALAASMWRQRPGAHAIQMWTGARWEALRPRTAPQPGTVRVAAPLTGYAVLHTTQQDGREPIDCTTFIDADRRMDDAAAVAQVTTDLADLARHAPSDVLHTLRLVHRTSHGDRVLLTPPPVRGSGKPLSHRLS